MSNELGLSLGSTVAVARDQVSGELAGEVVILNLKAGVYHGLESTGARVWQLVQEPRRVAEIRDTLLAEYDVEPNTCENDLLQFLSEMANHGLLDVRHETAA
jgi:hypothetical protein